MKNEINTIDDLMEVFKDFLKNRGESYNDDDLKIYKERFLRYQKMQLEDGEVIMQEFKKLPAEEQMCFYMYLRLRQHSFLNKKFLLVISPTAQPVAKI